MFNKTALPRLGLACALLVPTLTIAQLRIATWNVTNYSSGRVDIFKTAIYGVFEGRSMAPDVFIGQEFLSQTAVNNFLSILNTAVGSPGDWSAAPFIDGPDTDSAFFYRTTKVTYVGTTIAAFGSSSSTNQPRNTYRYDFRPAGYAGAGATIAAYSVHMKASNTASDQARRLVEAQRIRTDAESLPAGYQFLMAGDTNIQSSDQDAYQELVGSKVDNAGRFFDPIKTPGNWNNTFAFRFVHTQDPSANGQMDDRFDVILLSAGLIDNEGLSYIGNANVAYSTTTWNDPNHSYRCWGNDGTSYNVSLNKVNNSMVGNVIAQAITDSALTTGHCPVFCDMRVPPKVASISYVDFGVRFIGQEAVKNIPVWNSADTNLWGSNIGTLNYSFSASSGFSAPAGNFSDAAGGGSNSHTISMNTSTPGLKYGAITILSNSPDEPARVIIVRGKVLTKIGG